MAAKRASEEQEPAAKRAASSVRRLFVAAEDYRRALETCKQTIAAQCYCTSDEHLDAADTWIRSQPVDVIAKAVLRLVPDYATTSHIVYGLLAAFPAAWTSIVNGEPFVCRLYDNKQNRAGEMTQLFLELCSPEGANCVDSLGNTILYYAAGNAAHRGGGASVVEAALQRTLQQARPPCTVCAIALRQRPVRTDATYHPGIQSSTPTTVRFV